MTLRILYEADNLMLKQGTGIATYARTLTEVSRRAGHQPEILVGIPRPASRKNPQLTEIGLYDATPAPRFDPLRELARAVDWTVGVPFGADAVPLDSQGVVINPSTGRAVSRSHPTLAAVRLDERAYLHFCRTGRRMTVNTSRSYDLLHATQPMPIRLPHAANVYTIHDIVPLRLPYASLDRKKYFYDVITNLTRSADHIVTVSEFTLSEIVKFFPEAKSRITNTWQSVEIEQRIRDYSEEEISNYLMKRYNLEYRGYFLFVGAIEPKKNVSRMIEAFAASGTKHPLVLAGRLAWQYERDVEMIKDERFVSWKFDGETIRPDRRVQRLSYLPRTALLTLIRGARAVLFPSLYEGFGLPVLEAMLLGTPVITSNTSSLPEVAGDAAILVDPYEEEGISTAIRAIDLDADLRADLSRRGRLRAEFFSPARYEERIRAVYSSL